MAIKGMSFATAIFTATFEVLNAEVQIFNPYETKICCTGNRHAEKEDMIKAIKVLWSDIPWPTKLDRKLNRRVDVAKQEAIADSLACVYTFMTSGSRV